MSSTKPNPMEKTYYEPSPEERVWYRHYRTGDRGYLVRREGKTCIRYDRGPNVDVCPPFRKAEWLPMREHRPLTKYHVAQIAYNADQAFLIALGDYGHKTPWESLRDRERIEWMNGLGPGDGAHPKRAELYEKIMEVLRPMMA